jgi:hypothetical protein
MKLLEGNANVLIGKGEILNQSIALLNNLITALENLRNHDSLLVKNGIDEILTYCNGTYAATQGDVRALSHILLQKAATEATLVRLSLMYVTSDGRAYRSHDCV